MAVVTRIPRGVHGALCPSAARVGKQNKNGGKHRDLGSVPGGSLDGSGD